MSGENPYAANGYSYTNATNSTPSGRYGNIYAQGTNASSSSVTSYGSRERKARENAYGSDSGAPNTYEPSQHLTTTRANYGGLEEPGQRQRPAARERQYSGSMRSRERGQPASQAANGYRAFSPRRQGKNMDEVLQHIQSAWKFMGGDDCVPIQVALRLMDPSTLGLADRETDFQQTHVDLQRSLKSIVNEHHQDFNSSIGTYHKIQSSIQASQSRVRYLKNALLNAQGGLLTTKPELKGLATSSQELDDTLQLLGQIESIQAVPERLEARISEKRFLTAVEVLQEALRLIRKSELDGIGAIVDLRSYFGNQEQSLTDILIEELHDHLYLKSPYCQNRWKVTSSHGEEKNAQASILATGVNSWDRPVYHYLSGLDLTAPLSEDASRNPEADTFYYIHMIIESLNKLGHLENAITRVEQRMPVELFKVVDKTNTEIDATYPIHLRAQRDKTQRKFAPPQLHDGKGDVLSDFMWTLYAKFEAIAEGHRVLHDVAMGIVEREQLQPPEKYTSGFKELWKLYQSEIRSLLHDYLATDGDTTLRTGTSSLAGGDVFRSQRDRGKRLFKLSEMDQKSSGMQTEQDELDNILKGSVPGLVSKSRAPNGMIGGTDRSAQDMSAAGHKLLVDPSVFNMTILLPPSLAFLQHLKDIVPVGSNIAMSTLTSFLDDFLINIFHPQLEEAVTDLCAQCMMDLEAFTEHPQWSQHSPRPIFKGTVAFMSLIRAFSSMLTTIPQDQIFTQLVVSQLVAYYDKCHGWFKAAVSRLAPSSGHSNTSTLVMKAAAAYAESGEIHEVVSELAKTSHNGPTTSTLINKEVQLLLAVTKIAPLSAFDIISDPKSVHSLSLLYNSMQWLAASLVQIRHVDNSASKSHSRNNSQTQVTQRRWTLITNIKSQASSPEESATLVHLPLTSESAIPFDTTLTAFRSLAQTALITLHIDVRCGIIYQLSNSLRGGPALDPTPSTDQSLNDNTPHLLSQPPTSASPLILSITTDLVSFDSNTASYLGTRERSFITLGLAQLTDKFLVSGAEMIGVMNDNGANRIGLDILVLEMGLRGLTEDVSPKTATTASSQSQSNGLGISSKPKSSSDTKLLFNASQYYSLFLAGPKKIMEFVKTRKERKMDIGYSYDELRTLMELCYSSALRGEREESMKAKRESQDVLMALGEVMWDS